MDIHRIGGGIGFTVRHTHDAFLLFINPLIRIDRKTSFSRTSSRVS